MNAITITTCKRLNMFKQMLASLRQNLLDPDFIDIIIHYDDCSSNADRQEMYNLLETTFPNKFIFTRTFERDSFNTLKRHMEIMKEWKSDLCKMNLDYVFHTEDDFLYLKNFSLSEASCLLKDDKNVAYVGFSQELREFPDEYKNIKQIGNFWEWVYDENKPVLTNLFLDKVVINKSKIPGFWCYYINWPYFSFRPGIHDVKKLSNISTFREETISFELEFSIRYAKLYKSFFHIDEICTHIGDESAYTLNQSNR